MGVGKRIHEKAVEKGIKIRRLADTAGVPYSTLYSICKRDSDRISQEIALKVASALNVDVNWILYGYTLEERDNSYLELKHVRFSEVELQTKMGKLNSDGLKKAVDYIDLLISSGKYDRKPPIEENMRITVYGEGPAGSFPPKPEEDD